jgi:predicted transposase YbfD/YdcC
VQLPASTGVENGLHWSLDVTFREDDSRIRKGDGAQNFSILCRLALTLLKHEKTAKIGVKA